MSTDNPCAHHTPHALAYLWWHADADDDHDAPSGSAEAIGLHRYTAQRLLNQL